MVGCFYTPSLCRAHAHPAAARAMRGILAISAHSRSPGLEIQQSFSVPFTADQVWRRFRDVEGIVGCLPGAALSAPPHDGHLALSMTVKLGPIVATFSGEGDMLMDDLTRRGSISGSGNDRKSGSRLKGEANFSVHEAGTASASSRIDVLVSYSIAGALAQFSRESIVRELTERLTAAFKDNLQAKLCAQEIPATPVAVPDAAATPAAAMPVAATPAAAPAAPLNLGGMLWLMILERLRRRCGLTVKRSGDVPAQHD